MVDAVVERTAGSTCSCAAPRSRCGRRSSTRTDDDWQQVLDVNLKGPFLCLKHALPAMVRGRRRVGGAARLDARARSARRGYAAYCASKGALVNLSKQAAIEHAPDGVRVNVVSPVGHRDRPVRRGSRESHRDPEAIKAMVAERTPMGRLGTAADVCDAVLFLASDESSYISGTVIPLDGGMAARRT